MTTRVRTAASLLLAAAALGETSCGDDVPVPTTPVGVDGSVPSDDDAGVVANPDASFDAAIEDGGSLDAEPDSGVDQEAPRLIETNPVTGSTIALGNGLGLVFLEFSEPMDTTTPRSMRTVGEFQDGTVAPMYGPLIWLDELSARHSVGIAPDLVSFRLTADGFQDRAGNPLQLDREFRFFIRNDR